MLSYILFTYHYNLLIKFHLKENGWSINKKSIVTLEKCFRYIPRHHLERLTRKHLQTITVFTYMFEFNKWRERVSEALSYISTSSEDNFARNWFRDGYEIRTVDEYFNTCQIEEIRNHISDTLNDLYLLADEIEKNSNQDFYYRQTRKLFIEGCGYLFSLLRNYKETQYEE